MHSNIVKYSIKDLERLSGIKAHTIRIWEQRYQLFCPERSCGNIRFYKEEDLKLLLNVSVLIRNGGKISHISRLSKEEICDQINQLEQGFSSDEYFQTQCCSMLAAMMDLNEVTFGLVLEKSVSRFGMEETMIKLLIPFLTKVGTMWRTGESNVVQEHFASNLIRKRLCASIHELNKSVCDDASTFLLFLPKDEYHEIGLLFSEYLLRSRGNKVIYLGQSVPFHEVVSFVQQYRPDCLLTFFTATYSKDTIFAYIDKLSSSIEDTKILIAGNPLHKCGLEFPENTTYLCEVSDLIHFAQIHSSSAKAEKMDRN